MAQRDGRRPREPAVHENQIVPRDTLTLSLSFDHRALDGAPAAHFLNALRRSLEDPAAHLASSC